MKTSFIPIVVEIDVNYDFVDEKFFYSKLFEVPKVYFNFLELKFNLEFFLTVFGCWYMVYNKGVVINACYNFLADKFFI